MVGLVELYRAHGLEMEVSDLPDYLPVFLEFLSILPDDEAASLIGEAAHVLEAIAERLKSVEVPTVPCSGRFSPFLTARQTAQLSRGCWPSRMTIPTISKPLMQRGKRRR
ncbi:nitrate reductase molybdenum cofactor assembly chaperone [Hankyongella ginsenosidimutans]|uniref:nitrate reductase molybdenum cofactor assembly chaperone n=1 Tax=Hankyongella ginsenosidimutans TaxID=1763828 RepID=UPI001CA322D1|nr:molecular chaperone TorD family protein [Hankyongella ginsenosidimutans]